MCISGARAWSGVCVRGLASQLRDVDGHGEARARAGAESGAGIGLSQLCRAHVER